VVEQDGGAVGGDFYDVFGGVGVGGLEPGDYGFVEGFPCRVKDFGEAGLSGGEGVTKLYETLSDDAGVGAGEADDADAAASGRREMATMVSSNSVMWRSGAGFSYGTGRKKCWRRGGVFLQGFLRKVECRTWFFDGESVVDWW
jgi:hypothetical protein